MSDPVVKLKFRWFVWMFLGYMVGMNVGAFLANMDQVAGFRSVLLAGLFGGVFVFVIFIVDQAFWPKPKSETI